MRSTIYFLFLALLPIFSKAQDALTWSDQVITKSFHCNQSLDSLWWRWTTHEGLKTFFGADNKVDLKPGGAYEIYFLTDKPKGSQGTEGCTLLSILPKRMLSFSWIAPPSFPDLRKHPHKTWVVVELQPVAVNETNIIITHLGFPKGEEWKPLYEYFNGAWNYVVQNLKKLDGLPTKSTDKKSVQGIGGIFFKSKNPKELKQWYHDHLGMTIDSYGTSFEWRLSDDPSKKGLTQWSPFKETTDYFRPSTKDFMINYRVNDLEGLLEELKKAQVTICDSLEVYDYGKFIHILDPEGNKIELWEALETEKK